MSPRPSEPDDDDEPEPTEPTVLTSTTTSRHSKTLIGPTEQMPVVGDDEPGGLNDPTVPIWTWRKWNSTETYIRFPAEFADAGEGQVRAFGKDGTDMYEEYYFVVGAGDQEIRFEDGWMNEMFGFESQELNSAQMTVAWYTEDKTYDVTTTLQTVRETEWYLYSTEGVARLKVPRAILTSSVAQFGGEVAASPPVLTGDEDTELDAETDYTLTADTDANYALVTLTAAGMSKIQNGVMKLRAVTHALTDWEE